MKKTTALNPISTPLNSVVLIEASAGTGKTYTMVSLYLRLLLQVGQNNFSRPLSVEEILVVTFTEAATQELKERIRQRVHLAKQQLSAYCKNHDKGIFKGSDNEILAELVDDIADLDSAVERLRFAEQNMDLAAIYTIHGFCHRILTQYAFNSGIHFELELVKDESELLTHLSREFWRKNFYNLPSSVANFIHFHLKSPEDVLKLIQRQIFADTLEIEINQPHLLTLSLQDFINQYVVKNQSTILQFKQDWLAQETEIRRMILDEITKTYPKGEKKRLKRTTYNSKNTPNWLNLIQNWAQDDYNTRLFDKLSYFAQSKLNKSTEEGAEPLTHPLFHLIDQICTEDALYKKVILYHYIQWIKQELAAYKLNHKEKGFNDLLALLNQALQHPQGEKTASLIRHQYPFAMIDEFQDTDAQQYQIFHKIYMDTKEQETGFVMIGDPKQAIYQFRGADIFTYLNAAKQAKSSFTLGKNYRSQRNLVETVNALFDFSGNPSFLYQDIDFTNVSAQKEQSEFYLNGEIQPPLVCYIGDEPQLAQVCAYSVQQWLKSAVKNQAVLNNKPLQTKDIAVLVSDWGEAKLIKHALSELGIASVYLSDKSNVFDSKEARELALILAACLNPFSERNILNALATGIFALTSLQIQQIKQNEALLENWVGRFEKYQRLWQWQGVLPMLYTLLMEKDNQTNNADIPEKLLVQADGERRLIDILHLAELLQQAAALHESEAALLRWFERQIQGEDRRDGQEIRLESERQLVKIVTIHKSKGLEYGLVWLPFIASSKQWSSPEILTYYNSETQKIHWDINKLHAESARKEYYAEQMRLLYVALTRAKCQVVLGLPAKFAADKWNSLLYALTQGEIGIQEKINSKLCDTVTLLEGFKQRIGEKNILIRQTTELKPDDWKPSESVKAEISAAQFSAYIERNWTISSFTALTMMHAKNKEKIQRREVGLNIGLTQHSESAVENSSVFDNAADYDKEMLPLIKNEEANQQHDELSEQYRAEYPAGQTPFDFPQGIQVGLAVHSFFERNEFNQPINTENLSRICQRLQLDENWLEPLKQWLENILSTPLFDKEKFCLKDISQRDCLKEMQFYLSLKHNFDITRFNKLLQKYHKIKQNEPLLLDQIKGMIRGFIDLVFRYNGKYYLLDYKSNLLGPQLSDYAEDKLSAAMLHNHYDLQYLLYSLALHRYLRQRDATYSYETHFGGVIYTFIRGMNGKNSNYGVFFDCPDVRLINELDDLFYA